MEIIKIQPPFADDPLALDLVNLTHNLFYSELLADIETSEDAIEIDIISAFERASFAQIKLFPPTENPIRTLDGQFKRKADLTILCPNAAVYQRVAENIAGRGQHALRRAMLVQGIRGVDLRHPQSSQHIIVRLALNEVLKERRHSPVTIRALEGMLNGREERRDEILLFADSEACRRETLRILDRPRERGALYRSGFRYIVLDEEMICITRQHADLTVDLKSLI